MAKGQKAQKSGKSQTTKQNDATGRKRDQLVQENQEELKKREGEIAMVTAAEQDRKENEVVDLTKSSGTRHPGDEDAVVDASGNLTVDEQSGSAKTNETEVVGTGPESPMEAPGTTVDQQRERRNVDNANPNVQELARSERGVVDQGVRRLEPDKTFRASATVENMTFGVGNHYTFEEGRQYKVPGPLYDHLDRLGYVYH